MIKKSDIVLVLEKAALSILGFTLFLRLLISRFFTISPNMDGEAIVSAAYRADTIISLLFFTAAILFFIKLTLNKELFPRTAIDIPLMVFFIMAVASLLYSADKKATIRGIVLLFSNISVFYVLAGCLNSIYRAKLFMMPLIAAGLMVSLLGIVHYFFIYGVMSVEGLTESTKHMVEIKRIGSVFGWPNILGGFLILIIPLSVASIFSTVDKKEKFCMAAVTVAMILAMFLTYSILCWLSFLAVSVIFIYTFIKKSIPGRNIKPLLNTALIVMFLLGLFLFIIVKRMDLFTSSSAVSRLKYLRTVFVMIGRHPFLGNGLNAFGLMSSRLASSEAGFSTYAHNSYLQVWAETGIVGFAAFISIIGLVIYHGIRNTVNVKLNKSSILFVGFFWGITSFLVDNMFNFTILCPQTSLFWWASLAIMLRLPALTTL